MITSCTVLNTVTLTLDDSPYIYLYVSNPMWIMFLTHGGGSLSKTSSIFSMLKASRAHSSLVHTILTFPLSSLDLTHSQNFQMETTVSLEQAENGTLSAHTHILADGCIYRDTKIAALQKVYSKGHQIAE